MQEVCLGKALAATALVRYNQRAVPVLSYVAQFAVPPDTYKISALALFIPLCEFLEILFLDNLPTMLVFVQALVPCHSAATVLRLGTGLLSARRPILNNLGVIFSILLGTLPPSTRLG